MPHQHIQVPSDGQAITANPDFSLNVSNNPIIPYIEGDGIGIDISPVMIEVVNAAVEKSYPRQRQIKWMEIYAGEKATEVYGESEWLPEESLQAMKEYIVSIKGPLTTPIGGGIRSLNVSIRQQLDLYACVRPVRYFTGVPSPMKRPEEVDVVIFRENTEDVYAGIEYQSGSPENLKLAKFLREEMGAEFFEGAGLGVKPISSFGSKRLVRKAIQRLPCPRYG